MKIVIVRLEIDENEFDEARRLYVEETGREPTSDVAAIARDIQAFCYDDGGMHGQFQVLSVTDSVEEAAA